MTTPDIAARGPDEADRYRAQLRTPLPIEEVERIEAEMKSLWSDVLGGTRTDPQTAGSFLRFFATAGLLHKHKPYGVKIATPFGYSLFDLNEGEGFSFQQHLKPKLEGFNILRPKPGAFAYISTLQEWEASGGSWARRWAEGGEVGAHPCVTAVAAGDVVRMSEVGIVHTVIGAVLEEFASTSVDAVERLLDQNPRTEDCVPEQLCDVPRLLEGAHQGLPLRHRYRTADGWDSEPMRADEPIIELAGELVGRRLLVEPGATRQLASPPGWLTVALTAGGAAGLALGADEIALPLGEYAPIPPGSTAELRNAGEESCCVVLHQVPAHLSIADW